MPVQTSSASQPVTPQRSATKLSERSWALSAWCVVAAFGAYASMYAFRKPFTAGTYTTAPFGAGFKTWLVLAQVLGYTISKFIGIKVIAEMPPQRRATTLLGFVVAAHLALLLFALVPSPYNIACLFLNGLPLGMVFGLVLGFLEGRRMTEAFVAGLCASFILADGFTKSVGAYLLQAGVREQWMPFWAGTIFLLPLVGFVWMLQRIPAPTAQDIAARSARAPMRRAERWAMFRRHAPGLVAITLAYLLVTVLRSMRADFAPELWAGLGAKAQPGVFTSSEVFVALGVIAVNALVVLVRDNRRAFFLGLGTALGGLSLIVVVLWAQGLGWVAPFPFMVLLGFGLYLPYVAVHTTVFERLIAMTRDRANIGYLMYLADAFGYLGYVAVMVAKNFWKVEGDLLPLFKMTGWVVALASIAALLVAIVFFGRGRTSLAPEPRLQANAISLHSTLGNFTSPVLYRPESSHCDGAGPGRPIERAN